MELPTVYVIAGPTAVGKTAIAIELAKRLGTAIVSADSRQCYKEMSIGTAKPSAAEQEEIKHYFIDSSPVTEELDAADYEKLALDYLSEIFKTHKAAVVCGGTGLYIKALCEGLDSMPDVDEKIAKELNSLYESLGLAWLQQTVMQEDPEFYSKGEIKNPSRLLRALIFKRSTGESITHFRTGTVKERPFRIVKVGVELPREVLYERINHRVDTMMQQGLVEEVKKLQPFKKLKNLQTVGYTELFDHLADKYKLDEAVEKIKQNTRHYAKRQMTWLRKDKNINWLSAEDEDIVDKIIALT